MANTVSMSLYGLLSGDNKRHYFMNQKTHCDLNVFLICLLFFILQFVLYKYKHEYLKVYTLAPYIHPNITLVIM